MAEIRPERGDVCADVRELVRLARRCVSPFEDGDEATYTQAEALYELEAWFRQATNPLAVRR